MNDLNWYKEIGFPEAVISTAAEITTQVEEYYEIEFDEIFICNIQNEGQEEYMSLWMFSEQDVVECKNFLTRFDIDIAKYKGNVKYVNIITDKKETLFNPADSSTMRLSISLDDDIKCYFDAKGMNCKKLRGVATRFLREYKAGR